MATLVGKATVERRDLLDALDAQPGSRLKTTVGVALTALAAAVVLQATPTERSAPWPVLGILLLAPFAARLGKGVVASRLHQNLPEAEREQRFEVSERGVVIESGGAVSDVRWEHVLSCRESRSTFLLYTSPRHFLLLPKRAFGRDDLPRLIQLVRERTRGRASLATWQPQLALWAVLVIALVFAWSLL